MNRIEQKQFIVDLTGRIQTNILELIHNGDIPAEWGGFELRQYLADCFTRNVIPMSTPRRKEYERTITISTRL